MSSCGIRHVLLRPLSLLLAHYNANHDQKVQSQQKNKHVKGCEFQDLALLSAGADGVLVFDRYVGGGWCWGGHWVHVVMEMVAVVTRIMMIMVLLSLFLQLGY